MNSKSLDQQGFPLHSLKRLKLQNILSFSPEGADLHLRPLNVLVGPNACGKSNLLAAISLLRAAPGELWRPLSEGGGTTEWIWKGPGGDAPASVEAEVECPSESARADEAVSALSGGRVYHPQADRLLYSLRFKEKAQRFELVEERVEDALPGVEGRQVYFVASADEKKVFVRNPGEDARQLVDVGPAYQPGRSVLAQWQEPVSYPELTYLSRLFREYELYRDWAFGPNAAMRRAQRTDLPEDRLLCDASNLAVVLNDLDHRGLGPTVEGYLRRVYDLAASIKVRILGGTVHVYVVESGIQSPVPPERASDGTLRFLALLAILLHPEPPPLVCIEEPELGFHPDVMPILAELLVDASSRTQLIVTTHSPELVDEFSGTPESVLVCERTEQGTQMQRLDAKRLQKWLTRYRLGELWQKGEIGGTRW